ncbi:RNA 2',3'-cyclic phosphodiesterase [Candidatus Thiosymbion oneisti]|uniref:RNA 2',3'-cyclic phosphodiesterase n=1 Tax=Candidatus Thiosymbion oneisti TaxID=589554 RepID=UPI000AC70526|nr:RNA 2',3'-cyclic phosphodiesterase [Candidatus Thiosymbion oneisti]
MTERLFFALWPGEPQRRLLAGVQRDLPDHRGRKTHPQDLHLTLVFLGDLDAQGRACAEEIAGQVRGAPFVLNLDRCDCFPRAGVLWCGTSARPQPLLDLVQALNDGLRGCGFCPERRAFEPHVTLARKSRPLPARALEPPIIWPVSAFALVIARPGQCPRYQVERSWPLIP